MGNLHADYGMRLVFWIVGHQSLSPSSTIFFLRALIHRFPFMTRANNFSVKVVGVDKQTRVNVDKNDINMYIVLRPRLCLAHAYVSHLNQMYKFRLFNTR